jgi:hypothetical protein
MAFASDFNLEELMSEASQIIEASKNGGAPLPDLSNLKATISGLSNASVLDVEAERLRKWQERFANGETWIVSDDVVNAYCKRRSDGFEDYDKINMEMNLPSIGAACGMFCASIFGWRNRLSVGFCRMDDFESIGKVTIRMCEAWNQLNATEDVIDQSPYEDTNTWFNRMNAKPFIHFF